MKIKMPELKCLRCGHIWHPRKPIVRLCPRCKSAYWDTEKINKTKKGK
jgi:uncharacterized OB-fold protein